VRFKIQDSRFKIQDSRFKIQDSGCEFDWLRLTFHARKARGLMLANEWLAS
jgi:hypothetical protein